ncbi:hypothetical protein L228DRAFT_270807 [Xylona heveae TC161]|uniref:Zn(2)-C6 fungal-type domain-containing protein n=1 Tax=Xylona heveae (strain CBS 132557 / TC161) TaxID=1328760 RepID=A0A165A774_XYLHT|nr:hypothetical protein L228DRAFT_270807 [Xylona heveae TC161]KZF20052.1 hypothetical protein L228DRAFT_270807 [Xylona heveae TC161]
MDTADPEAKRPRLGSYSGPPQSQWASELPPHHHTNHVRAPQPPPSHLPPPLSYEPMSAEGRALPHPMSHSYNNPPPHPGYSAPVDPPRPFHPEQVFPRPGSATVPPPPPPPPTTTQTDSQQHPQLRPLAVPTVHDGPQHQQHLMDHHPLSLPHPPPHPHHHGPPVHESLPNGVVHHGMSLPHPHEPMPGSAIDHNGSYGPSPVSAPPAYGPGIPFGPPALVTSIVGPPRRKAIRATQACDACRARKAKCDEGRPSCGFCKETQNTCVYRDVPPAKQDRAQTQMAEQQAQIIEALNALRAEFAELRKDYFTDKARHMQVLQSPKSEPVDSVAFAAQSFVPPERPAPERASQQSRVETPTHRDSEAPNAYAPTMSRAESMNTEDIKVEERIGELSIPIEHTTAAQKLLRWPSIADLAKASGVVNENYVMEGEERRGLLRLYGRGEGLDSFDGGRPGPLSPAASRSSEQDGRIMSPASPPSEGLWGTGLSPPAMETYRALPEQNPFTSGAHQASYLKLDAKTIYRLFESYVKNVHILHPFLDKPRLSKMIETFVARYATSTSNGLETPHRDSQREYHAPSHRGPKRKRSLGSTASHSLPSNGSSPNQQSNMATLPERSISTALVLLVLALGRICEHKDPLPALVSEYGQWDPPGTYASFPVQLDSPPMLTKQSPSSRSPSDWGRPTPPSRRPSIETLASEERRDLHLKNIDVIPGLAYYAYATDILGNLHGGNDLPHIQANLLAGLYAGQLARVIESWAWINSASRACQVLIHPTKFTQEKDDVRRDLIVFAFWTCLQLESDILAELDLPASGISRYEDSGIGFPLGVSLGLPPDALGEKPETLMMMYYSAQIQLRKILNRAHSALYSTDKNSKHAGWSNLTSKDLADQLQSWRETLPTRMRWSDTDPPATDINAARLRGKYYGALYIIHRPFLHHAIHPLQVPGSARGSKSSSACVSDRQGGQDSPVFQNLTSDNSRRDSKGMPPPRRDVSDSTQTVQEAAEICIKAAMQSTIAFDGVHKRPIVTNIFGTAHAQFGNMLVLAATYRSNLGHLVPRKKLDALLIRTIYFLRNHDNISPTLRYDGIILEGIRNKLFGNQIASSSFSSTGSQ